MAKPILDCPRIMPRIGQGVAACVPQHMGVNIEAEAGALTDALYKSIDSVGRERAAALGGEHKGAVRELPA